MNSQGRLQANCEIDTTVRVAAGIGTLTCSNTSANLGTMNQSAAVELPSHRNVKRARLHEKPDLRTGGGAAGAGGSNESGSGR